VLDYNDFVQRASLSSYHVLRYVIVDSVDG